MAGLALQSADINEYIEVCIYELHNTYINKQWCIVYVYIFMCMLLVLPYIKPNWSFCIYLQNSFYNCDNGILRL
jgi:hypothetical protein